MRQDIWTSLEIFNCKTKQSTQQAPVLLCLWHFHIFTTFIPDSAALCRGGCFASSSYHIYVSAIRRNMARVLWIYLFREFCLKYSVYKTKQKHIWHNIRTVCHYYYIFRNPCTILKEFQTPDLELANM